MARKPGICAYCGKWFENITSDHVVANAFFGNISHEGLTVPACDECNKGKGDGGPHDLQSDEDYMRGKLCMGSEAASNAAAQSVLLEKVYRSFRPERLGLLKRYKQELAYDFSVDPVTQVAGIDWPRVYRVVRKITKGWFYFFHERRLSDDYVVIYNRISDAEQIAKLHREAGEEGLELYAFGDGRIFKARLNMVGDDPNAFMAMMIFYDYFVIVSRTVPAAEGQAVMSKNASLYQFPAA